MNRGAAVVAMIDRELAHRRIFQNLSEGFVIQDVLASARVEFGEHHADGTPCFNGAEFHEAIRAIESGNAYSAIVSDDRAAVLLMDQTIARQRGESCYALISVGEPAPGAEEFTAPSICQAVQ